MQRTLRSPLLWIALALTLALGAVAAWLLIDPPPVVHHAASIADEQRSLDHAIEAYTRYLEVRNTIFQEGGEKPERIDAVATHALAAQLFDSADEIRAGDYHYTGGWVVSEGALANRMIDEYGRAHVILRACLDGSAATLLSNADGSDVTNPDWTQRREIVEVTLVTMEAGSDALTPYSAETLPSKSCAPLP